MKPVARLPGLIVALTLAAGGCRPPLPAVVPRDPDVEARLQDINQRVPLPEQGLNPNAPNPVTTPPTCEEYEFIFK